MVSLKSLSLIENQALVQISCHGRKHLKTIFPIEIFIHIQAASTCMIDFFCYDRKSPLRSPEIVLMLHPLIKNYLNQLYDKLHHLKFLVLKSGFLLYPQMSATVDFRALLSHKSSDKLVASVGSADCL